MVFEDSVLERPTGGASPQTISERDAVAWLSRGVAALVSAAKPSQIRFAFDPVEINPSSEPLSQVAGAILEGEIATLPAAPQLVEALSRHLVDDTTLDEGDWPIIKGLWHLVSALEPRPTLVASARAFLDELQRRGLNDPTLLRAVISAVAAARPVRNLQITFFDYIEERHAQHWQPDLTLIAVEAAFEKAAQDAELFGDEVDDVWPAISRRWGKRMLETLARGGRPARALVLTLARRRQLAPGELTADALKEEIEARDAQPGDESTVRVERSEDVPELAEAL